MKKSIYTTVIRGPQSYLLHNTLSSKMMVVNNTAFKRVVDDMDAGMYISFDASNPHHVQLHEHGMIVDETVSEHRTVQYLHKVYERENQVLGLTMLLTRRCNFRCSYCYETLLETAMPTTLYGQIIDAIEDLVKKRSYKLVVIQLFGGEPTLEHRHANLFLQRLRKRLLFYNIPVKGLIISNGYLLDADMLREFHASGIDLFQITIDGPKHIHDAQRYLAGGEGTWHSILENLLSYKKLDGQFIIKIKTLFNNNDLSYLDEWLCFLKEHFGDDERFIYQMDTIRDNAEDVRGLIDRNFIQIIRKKDLIAYETILTHLAEHELGIRSYLSKLEHFGMWCNASGLDSFCIDTDGSLRKCLLHLQDFEVGRIANGKFVLDPIAMANFSYTEPDSECYKCEIFPLCFGQYCPVHRGHIYNDVECDFYRNYYRTILRTILIDKNTMISTF